MRNTGIEYEIFVQYLVDALLKADNVCGQKKTKVERRKIIKDNNGIDREIDVYWEFELAGIIYKNAIECKDYNSTISIEKIDALVGKLKDIPGVRGIFATQKGYQSGAETKAKQNGIELLIVRKLEDKDFVDEQGNSLISQIQMNITCLSFPRIQRVNIRLDKKYIEEKRVKEYPQGAMCCDAQKTYIETSDMKQSLSKILEEFLKKQGDPVGPHSKTISFSDAYIIYDNGTRLKLKEVQVEYVVMPPHTSSFSIDFKDIYAGVIEYLSNGKKTWIRKNGIIEER